MSNTAPVLDDLAYSIAYAENTVNAAPQFIDTKLSFADAENNFYAIATSTPGYVTVSGLLAGDIVGINNAGTGAGQIGISGDNITFGGNLFAVFAGGNGADLSVLLLPTATSAAVDALLENLTFQTKSDTPAESRTLKITVTDDQGLSTVGPISYGVFAVSGLSGVDVSFDSAPALADLDGDGDLDIVSGASIGTLRYLENTGDRSSPSYKLIDADQTPFKGIAAASNKPTFADLDSDGDQDLVIGLNDGTVRYFVNTGTAKAATFTEAAGAANPFAAVGVYPPGTLLTEREAAPAFADLDNDGDLDAVFGNDDGTFSFYRNTGSKTAPAFADVTGASDPFNGIDVGFDSTLDFADLDKDGDFDAFAGNSEGKLLFFLNTGTKSKAVFVQQNYPLNTQDIGSGSTIALGDYNNDGYEDLIVGRTDGTLKNYNNQTIDSIIVKVFRENDAPVITSNGGATGMVLVAENTPDVTFVTATDADSATNLSYSIVGGADAAQFFIDGDTGYVGFASLPDFENPGDANGDNDYEVVIQVSDQDTAQGAQTSTQTLTVRVGNVVGPLIFGSKANDVVDATHTAPTMDLPTGEEDLIFGWTGNDRLSGLGGNDEISGDEGNDVIEGGAGADQLDGGGGIDTLSYRSSKEGVGIFLLKNTTLAGDAAGDTIANFENVIGSAYYDLLSGDGNANVLQGLGTYDEIYGGDGDDTIIGGSGGDYMEGGGGTGDTLSYAGSAAVSVNLALGTASGSHAKGDTFFGFENLTGSAAGDTLTGDGLANIIRGGGGDDLLSGGGAADTLDGGDGTDSVSYAGSLAVNVNLATGNGRAGDAAGDVLAAVENLTGSSNDDRLTGSKANNVIDGLAGRDRIDGGGLGDLLTGGLGDDTFVLSRAAANADLIVDFLPGSDKLEVSATAFGAGLVAGALDPTIFVSNTSGDAGDSGDRFIYNTGTGELIFDSNGTDPGGARAVANFANLAVLSAADFVIV